MRVLLVDDEEEFVTTLAERMALRGIEADAATSGLEAVGMAERVRYDAVVLDLKMAGLGGLETLERIRGARPEIPCIILTGHSGEEEYLQGRDAGALFHLMKPVDIEVLIGKLREACGLPRGGAGESH